METDSQKIKRIIIPENSLEEKICLDSEFIEGAMWGFPRSGHPEGNVIYHIGEVLKNVDKYGNKTNREKLRLISIMHDTFKNQINRDLPREGDNDHGMKARRFAERYLNYNDVLEILELHDKAYLCWKKGNKGNWSEAYKRAKELIKRLDSSLDLYLTFYRCDNETGNKERENFRWFHNVAMP